MWCYFENATVNVWSTHGFNSNPVAVTLDFHLKQHQVHSSGCVPQLSSQVPQGEVRHGVLVWEVQRKTSVVWTLWRKPERRRRQWQSRLIQMNPGLPGLFILVGGWWLLCSAGVLICCQWSVAVQAPCYQGSGIGGPMESKHGTCPLLIYPRRNSVCILVCARASVSVWRRE